MWSEMPAFRKCLCCFPLRQGLLAWGYLKLISLVIYIIYVWIGIQTDLFGSIMAMILGTSTFVAGIDLIFQVVIICGIHLKKYKLLIAYNCYNIIWLCVLCGIISLTIFSWIVSGPPVLSNESEIYMKIVLTEAAIMLGYMYLVTLVWCEAKQMKKESSMTNGSYDRFDYQVNFVKEV